MRDARCVVYESTNGNTRKIAETIAEGLKPAEVAVAAMGHADADLIVRADLLVVGGPTHTFGMSRPQTRTAAADGAHQA
jgi:flavodoxin